MSTHNSVLVPTDFTHVARVALEHAVKLAETIESNVVLLHVVSKAADVNDAKDKLAEEVRIVSKSDSKVVVKSTVRIGNIFEDIAVVAAEESAELIIMGTHGASGWQKLTKSHALKVITSSEVPFVVVQNKGIKENGYDDIVVPMDFNDDTKQKLEVVADMAKYFNGRVHVFAERKESEPDRVKNNLVFAHKYLSEKGVQHNAKVAEREKGFDEQVIEYAKEIDADLIAIMNSSADSYFGGRSEQAMITNEEEIPIMIVNPVDVGNSGTVFTR